MRNIHYTLYREDSDYVAQCLDYDVSSFGATEMEAIANLKEAIELYLEDLPESATIPKITEVSFIGTAQSLNRPIPEPKGKLSYA